MSFAVWLTGADRARVDAVADAIADRLRSRALAVELLDARTPGADALTERAAVLVADTLARHGVATIVALPIAPDVARGAGMRMIEVCVRGEAEGQPAGCPDRLC